MDISMFQALLIGVITAICFSGMLLGIYTNRVIVLSFFVGLVLGDVKTGLAMGAIGELAFMGFGVGAGGTVPPNPMGPGVVGTIMAITLKSSGMTVETALALSYPFAVLFQLATTAIYTVFSGTPASAKKALEQGKYVKFKLLTNSTFIGFLVVGFAVGFISSVSMGALEAFVEAFPVWLLDGLTVAGKLLPAIGFAMIMTVMAKKEHIPYVLLGYALVAYLELPVMGVAIIAAVFALIVYFRADQESATFRNDDESEVTTDGI
ncbi:PTS sugar transporter subunit IIC [Schnuerera sp. xch1]|uniref:PTS mannose/fructose/sorbose/N-acetylgalactosamine transporter subunit IIC n=1 Tax=Schnuerera sp. xch1 TaxID=2874283 RepID=UPI001CBCD6B0|nr:PTS sugar transporter subunit IIC [Schnuerera sp. xch1]MBZ2174067.1 PTS sugar transporter subunit IIC [Schnuerera sp. xch1]